ncbi:hypothetical protein GCK32_022569, partial [Trichostrongylus colubriformis]
WIVVGKEKKLFLSKKKVAHCSNFVEDARQLGIHVLAWTVNESYQATFLRYNNVPFLTDYPQLLKGKQ